MGFQLGINTCFAVKRWPRPTDWAPIVSERLGLDLVQHSLDLVDLDAPPDAVQEQAEEVRSAARLCGLSVHSTFTGLGAYSSNLLLHPERGARVRAESWFRRAVAFTADVEAQGTGGHVGALSVRDWRDPARRAELWAELGERLEGLAVEARRVGQSFFLVENLAVAREPATLAQLRSLLRPGDETHAQIGLCLDVGHMCVAGTEGDDRDPYAWLRELGASAPVIQLQQSDPQGDHHWPFTAARNADGRIAAAAVLEALEVSGARDAALILEVIPPFEQADDEVLDDLEASVVYWRSALERRRGKRAG